MNQKKRHASEVKRAEHLHDLFLIARERQMQGGKLSVIYREIIRPQTLRRRSSIHSKRFYHLFQCWIRKPNPETLIRRWKSGNSSSSTAPVVAAVEAKALRYGLTLYSAIKASKLPISQRTIYTHSRLTKKLRMLASLERRRSRLLKDIIEKGRKS